MRVLVTGASGLLGRAVMTEFKNAGHEVIGAAYSRANGDLKKLNLEDSAAVEAFIDQGKYDVVVHCAAERRPDVVEKDPNGAKNLNVQVPGLLADLTNDRGILLIYISTDYVFDGTSPPYDVRDKANPLNIYGQTKYDGELEVKKFNSSAIILRVPILYGATEYNGESAVNALIDSVKDGKATTMDHYAIRYPTNVADVARVIKDLSLKVRHEKVFISGILHFSGEEKYTKYEMCEVIAKALGTSLNHLKPVDVAPMDGTTRPYDCHLSNRCLNGIGINTHCVKFSEWMQNWLNNSQTLRQTITMSRDATQNADLDFDQMMGELAAMKTDLANRQASRVTRPSAPRSATTDSEPRRTRTRRAPQETLTDTSLSLEAVSQSPSHSSSHVTIAGTATGPRDEDTNKQLNRDQSQSQDQRRNPHGEMPISQTEMRIEAAMSDSTSSGSNGVTRTVQSSDASESSDASGNLGLGPSESRRNPSAAPLPTKSAQRSRSVSTNSTRVSRTLFGDNGDLNVESAGYPDNLAASPQEVSTPTFGPTQSLRKSLRPHPSLPSLSTSNGQGGSASPQLPTRSNSRSYSKASPPSSSPSSASEQTPQGSPYGSQVPVAPPRSRSASRPVSRSNTLNRMDTAQDQFKFIGTSTIAEDQESTYPSEKSITSIDNTVLAASSSDTRQDSEDLRKKSSNNTLGRSYEVGETSGHSLAASLLPADHTPFSGSDRRYQGPVQGESEQRPTVRKQKSADPAAMYREHQQEHVRPTHGRSQSNVRYSPEITQDASENTQQSGDRGRIPRQEESSKGGIFSWARSRSKSKDASRRPQEAPSYPEYNPALIPTRSASSAGNQRAKSLPRKPSNQNLHANNEAWPPFTPGTNNSPAISSGVSLQHNKSITKPKVGLNSLPFTSMAASSSDNSSKNMSTAHHENMIRGMGMGSTPISPAVLLTPQPSFSTTASGTSPSQTPAGGMRNMALAMMKQEGSPSSSELQMQQRHQQLQQQQRLAVSTLSSNSSPATPTSPRSQTSAPQGLLSPKTSAPVIQRLVATRIYIQNETDFKSLNLAPNSTALDALHMLQQRGAFGDHGDPRYHDRWTIFEYSKEFLIERPLRDFEVILDVMKTWEADKDNKMICKSFPARKELSAQEIVRLVEPAGQEGFVRPHGWVHLETKKSKWVKRYLHITDTAVYHSKDSKFSGESMLCMLRNFDVYAVQVPRKKAPTNFGFALKSSDSVHMFETPEDDYIHYVCTDSGESLREWLAGLRAAKGMFMFHANPEQIREGQKRAIELMSLEAQEGLGRGNLTDEQQLAELPENTASHSDLPQGVLSATPPSNLTSTSASSASLVAPLELPPSLGHLAPSQSASELMSLNLAPPHLETNLLISHPNQDLASTPFTSKLTVSQAGFTNTSSTKIDTNNSQSIITDTTTTTITDKMPSTSSPSTAAPLKNPFMTGSLLQQRVEAEKQEIEHMKQQLKMREQAGVSGSRVVNDQVSSSPQYQYGGRGRGPSSTGFATSLSSSASNPSLHQPTPKFGGPGTLIEKGEARAAQLGRSKSTGTGLLRPSNTNSARSDFNRSRSKSRGPPEDRSHANGARSPRSHSPGASPSVPSVPQGPLVQFGDRDAMIQPGLLLARAKSTKQQGLSANPMGISYSGYHSSSQVRSPGAQHTSGGSKSRQAINGGSSHNLVSNQGQPQSASRTRTKPLIDLGNINTNQNVIGPGLLTANTASSSQSVRSPRRNKPLLEF
ncbi:hypothetical protein BGX27_009676 [Mortierella sp. AM989]|nr:hypothetical protein BGX27_009676 [Mortierella sp. AM989]